MIYILYIIKWLCKKPYPYKNKLPPCHRCHRHRCQLGSERTKSAPKWKIIFIGKKKNSLGREQKKALFHKNPKEKYKPQNQTMTDDSDDTHPNLFWLSIENWTLNSFDFWPLTKILSAEEKKKPTLKSGLDGIIPWILPENVSYTILR